MRDPQSKPARTLASTVTNDCPDRIHPGQNFNHTLAQRQFGDALHALAKFAAQTKHCGACGHGPGGHDVLTDLGRPGSVPAPIITYTNAEYLDCVSRVMLSPLKVMLSGSPAPFECTTGQVGRSRQERFLLAPEIAAPSSRSRNFAADCALQACAVWATTAAIKSALRIDLSPPAKRNRHGLARRDRWI